ncbi:MAG TPA: SpoIIE family protein phosphatase [Terriglobales bacterium]|jgi:sigma-B regulation protein RsbU (phosphoserine phosphatase)|nr:SpoIIE family protein phosphatase [Terriglobales bacterium]
MLPRTRLARAACYLLGLDLLLFALQRFFAIFKVSYGQALRGWVGILSLLAAVALALLAYRWLKAKLLWRLRNRLIVTYVFIGVIPVVLLMAMAFITLYLFAGQFANFVVTSELDSRLHSLQSVNAAIAHELAARLEHKQPAIAESLEGLKRTDPAWASRQICAWKSGTPLAVCSSAIPGKTPFALPSFLTPGFRGLVRDQGQLYLRTGTELGTGPEKLSVVSSEALDRNLLEKLAKDLGEITLYASEAKVNPAAASPPLIAQQAPDKQYIALRQDKEGTNTYDHEDLRLVFTAGTLSEPGNSLDHQITFGTPLTVVDWATGEQKQAGAVLRVETRPSVLYARLFAALGDFAMGVEYTLLFSGVVFAIIELLALLIGTRLTRTVTGAVAQLYNATEHINRGDFSHRIAVQSRDQLATLANSFNSMTASIENLIEEQKEKQRLQNELTIAQEVQSQLYPQHLSQLASLEVFGFCRPARTVSGDYYDFLALNSDRLILAVGDVSGKGISAALLMATIHSAVRAYSLESVPTKERSREPVAAGGTGLLLASGLNGGEVSAGAMLSLLNHQLYQSTPTEKYATLFLGIYDGHQRQLTYSNGGHLPPIILSEDGSARRLEQGGTVVGLFPHRTYPEASVALRRGELFVAYSDGVTEPENDFGEFGEQRLIDLVWEHRDQPLARISEIVTAAVADWIGANEQPDDITLVLARGR